jgi:N utilization substance protein A
MKRKKSKSKQTKSRKKTIAKRAKKQLRVKSVKRPKKVVNKKHAKKEAAKTRTARNQEIDASQEHRLQLSRSQVSGRQSGDLQGLSRSEQADSESVDELVEEGNLFEASAVAGVEHADDADEREVHTHEVPEDDVPEEYLEKD